jgi:lysophospholipase L1-like esterase
MDIGARFLEADGTISTTVMGDGLHPTARGYEIWAEAVMPTFRAMLGK